MITYKTPHGPFLDGLKLTVLCDIPPELVAELDSGYARLNRRRNRGARGRVAEEIDAGTLDPEAAKLRAGAKLGGVVFETTTAQDPYLMALSRKEFTLEANWGRPKVKDLSQQPQFTVTFRAEALHRVYKGRPDPWNIVSTFLEWFCGKNEPCPEGCALEHVHGRRGGLVVARRVSVSHLHVTLDVVSDDPCAAWFARNQFVTRAVLKKARWQPPDEVLRCLLAMGVRAPLGVGPALEAAKKQLRESADDPLALDIPAGVYFAACQHARGNAYTGLELGTRGADSVKFTLYDKLRESAVKGSREIYDFTRALNGGELPELRVDRGGKKRGTLWRNEFHVGRGVLREFKTWSSKELGTMVNLVDDVEDLFPPVRAQHVFDEDGAQLLDEEGRPLVTPVGETRFPRLAELWAYLTSKWLRIVEHDEREEEQRELGNVDDRNRIRGALRKEDRAVVAYWRAVQGFALDEYSGELVTEAGDVIAPAFRDPPAKRPVGLGRMATILEGIGASMFADEAATAEQQVDAWRRAVRNAGVKANEKVGKRPFAAPDERPLDPDDVKVISEEVARVVSLRDPSTLFGVLVMLAEDAECAGCFRALHAGTKAALWGYAASGRLKVHCCACALEERDEIGKAGEAGAAEVPF